MPELLKVRLPVLENEATGCQAAHRNRVFKARASRDSPGRMCAQGHPTAQPVLYMYMYMVACASAGTTNVVRLV